MAGDDILTLWGNLLANISSAPTRALLKQWAKPVELSKEHAVITVKNEIYLNQFVSGSKKTVLQNAVDALFEQKDTKITVRLPQPGDEIPSGNVVVPKPKAAPVPQNKPDIAKHEEVSKEEIKEAVETVDEGDDEDDKVIIENGEIKAAKFSEIHSDTVNMVMDLFDGKVID